MKDFRVELKVCEGCGALYLREAMPRTGLLGERPGVYCRICARWLSEFPSPDRRGRRGHRPKTGLRVVCAGGGR